MRYEKLTLVHCVTVTLGVAGIAAAYQHVTGSQDYQATVVPTIFAAAISGANYLLARYTPFGGKTKKTGGKQKAVPQPTLKPQQ